MFTPIRVSSKPREEPPENFAKCKYCGTLISLKDGKDHLEADCAATARARRDSLVSASRIRKLAERCMLLSRVAEADSATNDTNARVLAEPQPKRRAVSADNPVT